MAIGNLEIRIAHLEGAYEQIDKRLGAIEQDVRGIRGKMSGLRHELVTRMDRQFYWMLGLLIVSILLPFAPSIGH